MPYGHFGRRRTHGVGIVRYHRGSSRHHRRRGSSRHHRRRGSSRHHRRRGSSRHPRRRGIIASSPSSS